MILADISYVIDQFGAKHLLVKMTYITELVSSIWLTLSIILHWRGENAHKEVGLFTMAVHHTAFELSVLTNTITIVVYWTLLHADM